MSINQEFLDRVRHDIAWAKQHGTLPARIRMCVAQAKLIEAEFAVIHDKAGGMSISGVLIVLDEQVPYGNYQLD